MRAAPRFLQLRPRGGRTVALLAASALLASSAVALGALPKHGASFTGKSSESPINGFSAPVLFTVAKNGKSLTGFRYSTLGCFGGGGFRPGVNYYAKPEFFVKVPGVRIAAGGRFSAIGVKYSRTAFGQTTTTTSKVTGSFTKSKAAKGTIVFSQDVTGQFNSKCGPGTLQFTAKAH